MGWPIASADVAKYTLPEALDAIERLDMALANQVEASAWHHGQLRGLVTDLSARLEIERAEARLLRRRVADLEEELREARGEPPPPEPPFTRRPPPESGQWRIEELP